MPVRHTPPSRLIALLAAAVLAASATAATAAPFATTYEGEVGQSTFPEVYVEQPYTITLVLDNNGSTAAGQTWEASNLRCIIWRFNGNQSVVYAQDLLATPPFIYGGAAHTDASGVLDGFFTGLVGINVPASAYTVSGIQPPIGIANWWITGTNAILSDYDQTRAVHSTLGGVSVNPARWSNPAPFTGPCAAPTTTTAQPTHVPALGTAGLALMSGLIGAIGWRRRKLRA